MLKNKSIKSNISNNKNVKEDHILCSSAIDNQIDDIVDFILDGIKLHQTSVVIANGDTIIKINKILRNNGQDIISLMNHKKYITYDAEELLKKLKKDEHINHEQLYDFIHDIIHLESEKSTIRFYCELVSNLMAQENYSEALKLENFLNTLLKYHKLLLYCSYRNVKVPKEATAKVTQLISCHGRVVA